MPKQWTSDEMRKFRRLTDKVSSLDGGERVMARLELRQFVAEVGKEKCDLMWADILRREAMKHERAANG